MIVKHANPCGVCVASAGCSAAYDGAYRTDPTSAFGGIIAFNRPLDAATAAAILDRQFVEVIVAPPIAEDALAIIAGQAGRARARARRDAQRAGSDLEVRSVTAAGCSRRRATLRSSRRPTSRSSRSARPRTRSGADLQFAWRVCKFVKSNAIIYAREAHHRLASARAR